jgi:hypothetical protein
MTAKQGQEYFTGSSDKRIIKIWKENLWCYDISIESNEWVSDFVDAFFNSIIIPRKRQLKNLLLPVNVNWQLPCITMIIGIPGFILIRKSYRCLEKSEQSWI